MAEESAEVEALLADALARAQEGYSNDALSPNEQVRPNRPKGPDKTSLKKEVQSLQMALYGSDFPGAQDDEDERDSDEAWVSWVRGLWSGRSASVQEHLHLTERNRLFRSGQQWISSQGAGAWREPQRPRDSARVVYNMVDKALDQRLQVITEQRPGFAVTPTTSDPDDKRKASAQQMSLEYQFDQLDMINVSREATFWSQTDGCSFWHMFWDPDRGPWDERMAEQDQTEEGVGPSKEPLGDVGIQTLRVEQVRVSPNATATIKPYWTVIRDVIPRSEAAFRYGIAGVDGSNSAFSTGSLANEAGAEGLASWVLSRTTVGEGQRMRDEDVVERFTVYLAPQADALPDGLHIIVVGNEVVFGPSPLLWGVIPVVRVPDGSSDPSYFNRPTMEQWLDHQMRVNALLSKWIENIRVNAGGRFLTRPNAITSETFMGGVTSMIEVRGAGPMAESIQPVNGFSVGNDVKEALMLEKTAFEDASGWNQVSRGQVTGESGRAIIANREQLERVFAPPVTALANAYTQWCKIVMAAMQWGYSVPRSLGVVGKGRPDLARAISQTDFDGASDVKVEAATMMPMPLAFRMYLLDNWLATGVIDQKEYRRRQQFAIARDISTPDEDQEARAKRISDALRMEIEVPEMRWQDDEAIHQDVLDREILLQDDLSPQVIQAASERWTALANQAAQKNGAMVPPEAIQQGALNAGEGQASGSPMAPGNVPPTGMNPAMGSVPIMQQTAAGMPDSEILAQQADALSMQ